MSPSLVTMPSRLTSCRFQPLEYNNNNKINIIHIHTIYIHMIHIKNKVQNTHDSYTHYGSHLVKPNDMTHIYSFTVN